MCANRFLRACKATDHFLSQLSHVRGTPLNIVNRAVSIDFWLLSHGGTDAPKWDRGDSWDTWDSWDSWDEWDTWDKKEAAFSDGIEISAVIIIEPVI